MKIKLHFLIALFLMISIQQLGAQCSSDCNNSNTYFGSSPIPNNINNELNSIFGDSSGFSLTTGSRNSFFGSNSGKSDTRGGNNSFFGHKSGANNTFGDSNEFIGVYAGYNNISGGTNTFIGSSAGFNSIDGSLNVFIGASTGEQNLSGDENTFIGASSGISNSGNSNTFLGRSSGIHSTRGSGNIIIGRGAGPVRGSGNQDLRLYIDVDTESNSGNDNPLIYGEFDNDFVRINGTFEVTAGLTNPSSIALKERFISVTPSLILDKISELNISEWSYKTDPTVRHIGPTAESFYQAFGLGTGDDNISTIDADGISLVAILALQEQSKAKDELINSLEERLTKLEAIILELEKE